MTGKHLHEHPHGGATHLRCEYHVRWDETHQRWSVVDDFGEQLGYHESQGGAVIIAARAALHNRGHGYGSHVCIEGREGEVKLF